LGEQRQPGLRALLQPATSGKEIQERTVLRKDRAYVECVPEAGAVAPVVVQLLGDRGPTDEVPALQDQGPQSRLGQVGTVGQPVVSAADDDRVVGAGGAAVSSTGILTSYSRFSIPPIFFG